MKHIINLWLLFFVTIYWVYGKPFPNSNYDGKYYTVNGKKIWAVSFGKGEPVFFIAGGPGASHVGLRDFDSLIKNHTLIYFDALGRGKSDTADRITDYSLERDIDDLDKLRQAMGYSQITLLGHSYGGVVAQGYATRYPQWVSHLILVSTFHSYEMWQENNNNSNHSIKVHYPEIWDSLMIIREEGMISSDPIHQALYSKVPYGFLYAYNPENIKKKGYYPNKFNSTVYYQMIGKDGDFIVGSDIGNFDFRKKLKNLKMPILIIGGRYDAVSVPWMMIKYKKYCPQATFEMFEYSGHNPQIEEPAKIRAVIMKFLSQ